MKTTISIPQKKPKVLEKGVVGCSLNRLMDLYLKDQHDLTVVKKIAELYKEMGHVADAYIFYEWGYTISQNDISLKHQAALMKKRMDEEAFRAIEREAKANPDDEKVQNKLRRAQAERLDKDIESAQKRVDMNPTDPTLRFELAMAFYNKGSYSEAIPHLQMASQHPHIRTRSLLLMAKAFIGKGGFDLGVKQLETALVDLHAMDDIKKEILYEKGLAYERMKRGKEALEAFKQIYEVDYNYKDVSSRVEGSYGGES